MIGDLPAPAKQEVPTVRCPEGGMPDEIKTLVRERCGEDLTDSEFRFFLYQCIRTGLDPLSGQICAVKRYDNKKDRYVVAVQIEVAGLRILAERTGRYRGQLGPEWVGKDGQWRSVWTLPERPVAARVGILMDGFREPLWGFAYYAEVQQPSTFWSKAGLNQVAKCAEANGFRRAVPSEASGLYINEEMPESENRRMLQSDLASALFVPPVPPKPPDRKPWVVAAVRPLEEWIDMPVPDQHLPQAWKGCGYTFRRLATDPTIVDESGVRRTNGRSYIHSTWEPSMDLRMHMSAKILLDATKEEWDRAKDAKREEGGGK